MIYMDPPFFTQKDWIGPAGRFSDRWSFDAAARERLDRAPALVRDTLGGLAGAASPRLAYLLAMHELVAASWSRLRTTGSLWLHCDDTASAYLRLVLDLVFGAHRFWGQIFWRRTGHTTVRRGFERVLDTIIVYVRTGAALSRAERPSAGLLAEVPGPLLEIDGVRGRRVQGALDERLASTSKERIGYPTQKPVNLIARLIDTATRSGDLVVDPCCGSGSTLVAAARLGRVAIGIDQSPYAVALACTRLDLPEVA